MDEQKSELIRQVMGASNVFCSALADLLDEIVDEASDGTLTLQQIKLMLLISRPEHRFKVMDIADFLGVTNAAASRAIDRLVQRGLIDRTISPDDRRAVDLALTADGHGVLERFSTERNDRLGDLLHDFSDRKLTALLQLLDEISPVLLRNGRGSGERCVRCGIDVRASCVLRDVMGHRCAGEEATGGRR
jgi:DNA-binding MarR family transcriptional regulator